jgi:NADH:ubiquinone oxidoreductase subunit K
MLNDLLHIGLTHFVVLSIALAGAGVATMLTKRNAIGILIGVELILNAASLNLVAFNHYQWRATPVTLAAKSEMLPGDKLIESPAAKPVTTPAKPARKAKPAAPEPVRVLRPAIDGQMFALFIVVLAAAEAAVALSVILNFYNRYGSIDVERADALHG